MVLNNLYRNIKIYINIYYYIMAGAKKGVTYKTGYKFLKNMISDKLDKEYQISTKKERKEVVKGVMEETKSVFENGIADYLDSSINDGMHNFFLINKEKLKVNVKEKKKVKTKDSVKPSVKTGV